MVSYETLTLEPAGGGLLLLTLNRPSVANALNTQMGHELAVVFEQLTDNPSSATCVVVTGAGNKAFCAGGDLKERQGMTDAEWLAQHRVFERAFRALLFCPVPTIAAVNGAAYGGGCEIVLACDWAYAANTAMFAQTETRLGIIPGGGGTQTLARAVGVRRAKELILTAQPFTAAEAAEWGLLNAVHTQADLLNETMRAAQVVGSNSPRAVRQAKLAVSRSADLSLFDGLSFEIEAYNHCAVSHDRREGVLAFAERRPPKWEEAH